MTFDLFKMTKHPHFYDEIMMRLHPHTLQWGWVLYHSVGKSNWTRLELNLFFGSWHYQYRMCSLESRSQHFQTRQHWVVPLSSRALVHYSWCTRSDVVVCAHTTKVTDGGWKENSLENPRAHGEERNQYPYLLQVGASPLLPLLIVLFVLFKLPTHGVEIVAS